MNEEKITLAESKEFFKILQRLLKEYRKKPEQISDEEWLYAMFKEEFPNESEKNLTKLSQEVVENIQTYDKNLEDLNRTCKSGGVKEKWFADKVSESAKGVAIHEYGEYLNAVDNAISAANTQMYWTVTTNAGEISLCRNLDGFIAEQHQVNSFNQKAVLEKSPYRAEVCAPLPGETYGKNSFDVIIKDIRTGKRVNQYQFKFGKDAKTTIELLKGGNYNNQRFVVPEEQVKAVKEAFPNKSVESFIGGNGEIQIQSDALSKQSVKDMQMNVQQNKTAPTVDWNSYNTKNLALKIGHEAGLAGIHAAAITVGFDMASKVLNGEKIDADETVEFALKTGADTGVKTATAGAIKIASEKGILRIIPKGTPGGTIASIACVAIENIKILMKVANGELTMSEALEHMGRTSTTMVAGLASVGTGAAIGAAALRWIPVVGPVIGGLAGGMLAYTAGSKIGETVFNVARKVKDGAKRVVKNAWEKTKNFGGKILSGIKSIFS